METFNRLCALHPSNPIDRTRITNDYIDSLAQIGPAYAEQFSRNLTNHSHGAWSESVSWHLFQEFGFSVSRFESPSLGGPDFIVKKGECSLLAECTNLSNDAVHRATGLDPNRFTELQGYDSVTERVTSAIGGKVRQLAEAQFSGPRLLIIAAHDPTFPMLNATLAQDLIAPIDHVIVPLQGDASSVCSGTSLSGSAFYTVRDGHVAITRRSISAVLLMEVFEREARLCGVVHPDPLHPLDIRLFPDIPWFVPTAPQVDGPYSWNMVWENCVQRDILPTRSEQHVMFSEITPRPRLTAFPRG